jgi:hypothetical protein
MQLLLLVILTWLMQQTHHLASLASSPDVQGGLSVWGSYPVVLHAYCFKPLALPLSL